MYNTPTVERPSRPSELVTHKSAYTGKEVRMKKTALEAMQKTLAEFKDINEDLTEYVSLILEEYPDMKGKLRVFKGVSEGKGLENYPNRNYLTFEVLMITYKGADFRVYVSEFNENRNLELILNSIIDGKRSEPKTEQPAYKGITGTTIGTEPREHQTNLRPKRGGAERIDVQDADAIRAEFGRRKR